MLLQRDSKTQDINQIHWKLFISQGTPQILGAFMEKIYYTQQLICSVAPVISQPVGKSVKSRASNSVEMNQNFSIYENNGSWRKLREVVETMGSILVICCYTINHSKAKD